MFPWATSHPHYPAAFVEMWIFFFFFFFFFYCTWEMTRRSTGPCCWEAEKRPEASSPLEGFLTSRSTPYGIPPLDMPRIGSQGAQGEGRSRTRSTITERDGVRVRLLVHKSGITRARPCWTDWSKSRGGRSSFWFYFCPKEPGCFFFNWAISRNISWLCDGLNMREFTLLI